MKQIVINLKRLNARLLLLVAMVLVGHNAWADNIEDTSTSTADTWVRLGNTTKQGSSMTMEIHSEWTTENDSKQYTKDFVGLMQFEIPLEAKTSSCEIVSATLRLTTNMCKGATVFNIYSYGNAFDEANALYSTETTYIDAARKTTPIQFTAKYGARNKALSDNQAESESFKGAIANWTNTIDITSIVKAAASNKFQIMIDASTSNSNAAKFYTKEATGFTNSATSVEYTTAQLIPQLTVTYKKVASVDYWALSTNWFAMQTGWSTSLSGDALSVTKGGSATQAGRGDIKNKTDSYFLGTNKVIFIEVGCTAEGAKTNSGDRKSGYTALISDIDATTPLVVEQFLAMESVTLSNGHELLYFNLANTTQYGGSSSPVIYKQGDSENKFSVDQKNAAGNAISIQESITLSNVNFTLISCESDGKTRKETNFNVYKIGSAKDAPTLFETYNSFTLNDSTVTKTNLTLAKAREKEANIKIERTFYKGGINNTICLPFSLNADQLASSPLSGCTLKEVSGATVKYKDSDNQTIILTLKDATEIVAGKPYIISWTDSGTIENPVFDAVTVTTDAGTKSSKYNGVTFCGTLVPYTVSSATKGIMFINSDGSLKWANVDNAKVKGFRCYFTVD